MKTPFAPCLLSIVLLAFGCSDNSGEDDDSPIGSSSGGAPTGTGAGGDGTVVGAGGDVASGGSMMSTGGVLTTSGGATDPGSGGIDGSGGDGSGGMDATGGMSATGGGGGTQGADGPCDIYDAGGTPCVAAHSTVRALYGGFSGALYQVRRASDDTTKDIGVLEAGSYVDAAQQDSFCSGTTCVISVIYDQSSQANHLTRTPKGGWLDEANGGTEADATAAQIQIGGHTAYGVYTWGSFDDAVGGVGYRNNNTSGVAVDDEPETIYMVASGSHYNQWCCFDYGNAETNNLDNGPATMETLYFGTSTQWGRGSGAGPWVMADLEDGVFAGGSFDAPASNTPLIADFITAMLKGHSGDRFALKGGDAQSGPLMTKYDGTRPTGYSPQKKEGAIILGVGGDNSHTGEGTFFEGAITAGVSSDDVDDAVAANIVSAGYGQ